MQTKTRSLALATEYTVIDSRLSPNSIGNGYGPLSAKLSKYNNIKTMKHFILESTNLLFFFIIQECLRQATVH